jgi:hypothetical protein
MGTMGINVRGMLPILALGAAFIISMAGYTRINGVEAAAGLAAPKIFFGLI